MQCKENTAKSVFIAKCQANRENCLTFYKTFFFRCRHVKEVRYCILEKAIHTLISEVMDLTVFIIIHGIVLRGMLNFILPLWSKDPNKADFYSLRNSNYMFWKAIWKILGSPFMTRWNSAPRTTRAAPCCASWPQRFWWVSTQDRWRDRAKENARGLLKKSLDWVQVLSSSVACFWCGCIT